MTQFGLSWTKATHVASVYFTAFLILSWASSARRGFVGMSRNVQLKAISLLRDAARASVSSRSSISTVDQLVGSTEAYSIAASVRRILSDAEISRLTGVNAVEMENFYGEAMIRAYQKMKRAEMERGKSQQVTQSYPSPPKPITARGL